MSIQPKTFKVIVLCTNSNGEPEFHTCTPSCTQEEFDEGQHYKLAKENAEMNGYDEPMIAFDANDLAARQIPELSAWI